MVFDFEVETKARKLKQTDSTAHRRTYNFLIQPNGKIWHKLCVMYDLRKNEVLSAVTEYNEANDPTCT